MNNQELLARIVVNQRVMVGKSDMRGTHISVEHITGLLADDVSPENSLERYKGLTKDDVRACILFATRSLEDTSFTPFPADIV